MERYDGKTRRDDYRKYALIGLGAVLIVAALLLLKHFVGQEEAPQPDYTVVLVSQEAFSEDMRESLASMLEKLVGDRNGDGDAVVQIEFLRITDEAAARKLDAETAEAFLLAMEAGDLSAVDMPEARFSGLTVDADAGKLMISLAGGECTLYVMSDQPLGDFPGAATAYSGLDYFLHLPEDLGDPAHPDRAALTGAPFWAELGLEDVPFYAFILDSAAESQQEFALELIRQLRSAHLSLW